MGVKRTLYASLISLGPILLLMAGCASPAPFNTPERVDLPRFMGAWYVVGYTPILVDKGAHNAVEHYAPGENGRILTTYQFRDGGFDGDLKTFRPTGFVRDDPSNAEWGMQFIWPFKADYIILYVSEDYRHTIIAHPSRKYAWIMQRSPEVDEVVYERLLLRLEEAGYDRDIIRTVPHDWSHETERLRRMDEAGTQKPLAPR